MLDRRYSDERHSPEYFFFSTLRDYDRRIRQHDADKGRESISAVDIHSVSWTIRSDGETSGLAADLATVVDTCGVDERPSI